jgi:aspartate racemase
MKTIGLLGGMSWKSSATYYDLINSEVARALGKSHSAPCLLYSFDFQVIEELQNAGAWGELREHLFNAARRLKNAGADFVVLCANTMHKVMDGFEADVGLPLVHIVDVVGQAVCADGLKTVGLLGTRFTMEESFYRAKLEKDHGLEVLVPEAYERVVVNRVIYEELVRGIIRDDSREAYRRIMEGLRRRGAQGIILGCTEIGLLVHEQRTRVYDSAELHAQRAAELCMEGA